MRGKLAIIIIVSLVCGGLAFVMFPSTKYAIAATILAWLASVFTIWLVEDELWIKRG